MTMGGKGLVANYRTSPGITMEMDKMGKCPDDVCEYECRVWNFSNPFPSNRWPGINKHCHRPNKSFSCWKPWCSYSKMCFFISPREPATAPRKVSRLFLGLFFVFEITFSEIFSLPRERTGGRFGRRWKGGSEKFTKGQFILFTLIKSYVLYCSIFQLFEITFLLLFVFLFGVGGEVTLRALCSWRSNIFKMKINNFTF